MILIHVISDIKKNIKKKRLKKAVEENKITTAVLQTRRYLHVNVKKIANAK